MGGVKLSLESTASETLTVFTESEVRLVPWTVVSYEGWLITEGEIREGLCQIIPINKYESGEEEIIFFV